MYADRAAPAGRLTANEVVKSIKTAEARPLDLDHQFVVPTDICLCTAGACHVQLAVEKPDEVRL